MVLKALGNLICYFTYWQPCPACGRWAGTWWSLRTLPTQIILWFYENLQNSHRDANKQTKNKEGQWKRKNVEKPWRQPDIWTSAVYTSSEIVTWVKIKNIECNENKKYFFTSVVAGHNHEHLLKVPHLHWKLFWKWICILSMASLS